MSEEQLTIDVEPDDVEPGADHSPAPLVHVPATLPATAPPPPGQDIFARFDALDDDVIMAELEGRLVDVAVYHFNQDGKELWGMGKVGVDWAVNELARKGYVMRDEDLTFMVDPTDPTHVLFTGKVGLFLVAKDGQEARVTTTIGTKRQWTKIRRRDGTTIPDTFWFEKGSQKAIRNARLRLIPEEVKAEIIAQAKGQGKVREVKGESRPTAQGKAPLTASKPKGENPYDKERKGNVIKEIDKTLGAHKIDREDFKSYLWGVQGEKHAVGRRPEGQPGPRYSFHMGNLRDIEALYTGLANTITRYRKSKGAK